MADRSTSILPALSDLFLTNRIEGLKGNLKVFPNFWISSKYDGIIMKFIKAILLMALFASSSNMQAGESTWAKSPLLPCLAAVFASGGMMLCTAPSMWQAYKVKTQRDIPRYSRMNQYANYLDLNHIESEFDRKERAEHRISERSAMGQPSEILLGIHSISKELETEPTVTVGAKLGRGGTIYSPVEYIEKTSDRHNIAMSSTDVPKVIEATRSMHKDFVTHSWRRGYVKTCDKNCKKAKIAAVALGFATVATLGAWGILALKNK